MSKGCFFQQPLAVNSPLSIHITLPELQHQDFTSHIGVVRSTRKTDTAADMKDVVRRTFMSVVQSAYLDHHPERRYDSVGCRLDTMDLERLIAPEP